MLTFKVKGRQPQGCIVTVAQLQNGDFRMTCSFWAGEAYNVCRQRVA